MQKFYETNYPSLLVSQSDSVKQAIHAVQEIYNRSFFPAMHVDWRTYPENIGHLRSPGCFRCHDGLHVNEQGTAITSDCMVCHTFLNPVEGQPGVFKEGKFEHSMAFTHHENLRCEQCHTGGELKLCRDCHKAYAGLDQWEDEGHLRRLIDQAEEKKAFGDEKAPQQ